MKDAAIYERFMVRRAVIEPEMPHCLECPWPDCPTVTQQGVAGQAAHIRVVHKRLYPLTWKRKL